MDINKNKIYQSVLILKVSESFLFSEKSIGADMGQWYLKKAVKYNQYMSLQIIEQTTR